MYWATSYGRPLDVSTTIYRLCVHAMFHLDRFTMPTLRSKNPKFDHYFQLQHSVVAPPGRVATKLNVLNFAVVSQGGGYGNPQSSKWSDLWLSSEEVTVYTDHGQIWRGRCILSCQIWAWSVKGNGHRSPRMFKNCSKLQYFGSSLSCRGNYIYWSSCFSFLSIIISFLLLSWQGIIVGA